MQTNAAKVSRVRRNGQLLSTVLALSSCAPAPITSVDMDAPNGTSGIVDFVAQSGRVDNASAPGLDDLGALPPLRVSGDKANFLCSLERYRLTKMPEEFLSVDPNADTIFAGSLIQGRSLADGVPSPIPVRRAPATVSLVLATGTPETLSEAVPEPTLSSVLDAQNRILARYTGGTPARFSYVTSAVHSLGQLATELNANVHGPGWELAGALSFNERDEKQRLLVRFTQAFYTVAVDPPQGAAGVFAKGVTVSDLSPYVGPGNPPLYVSSVTYGRIFYLLFESTVAATDLQASIQAAVDLGIQGSGGLDARARKVVNESSLKAYALGGDAQQAILAATGASLGTLNGSSQKVEALGKIAAYLRQTARFSKDNPGVPLSYAVRYLGDSSQVKLALTTEYTAKNCKPTTNCIDDQGNKGTLDDCDVCNGDNACLTAPCPPKVVTHREPNCAFLSVYLPSFGATKAAPHGTLVDIRDGVGHGYIFPTCRRIAWRGVKLRCDNGTWVSATPPLFDNDSYCHGDLNNDVSNNVATGADSATCSAASDF